VGRHPHHQAVHRRRLRQQAGRALRAALRLLLHAGGRPLREDRLLARGDLRLQPRPPRHPQPHHLLAPPGRHLRRAQARGVLRPGRLRLPRPRHRRQGHGRVPAAVSLPERRVRQLHRLHEQARLRRHARLRHPAGHVLQRGPHRRVREGRRHEPDGFPPPEPHARGLHGRVLQELQLLRHLQPVHGQGRRNDRLRAQAPGIRQPDRPRAPRHRPCDLLVQHGRVPHLARDLLQPHAAQSRRHRHHAVRRDRDRPGRRHRLRPDDGRGAGPQELPRRARRLLPGHGHHADRPRRLRLPPDLHRGLLHPPDGRAAQGEDPQICQRGDPPGHLQHGHRGRQHRPHDGRQGAHEPQGARHDRPVQPRPLRAHHGRVHLHHPQQRLFLRLHVRRGRGRHPDVQGEAAEHGERPRLRPAHQPGAGRSAGARRHVHGHRLRPVRAAALRPQDRQAAQQQPARLQALHLHGSPDARGRVRRELRADLRLRHEGAGRAARVLRRAGHPQRHLSGHRRGDRPDPDYAARPVRPVRRSGPHPGIRGESAHV